MNSSKTSTLRRRFLRVPIAALSALALTAGAFAVPNLMSGDSAAAADFTGGIREKSGAVEKDAQKASDLPAGSCVVSENTPKGSQAGFSWDTLEPGADSPSKTRWGLSVSFDNSEDRTFADWSFTNSGLMGAYLDAGQVPSMRAGQNFLGNNVTDKATENLGITASRQQRNLNLNAELTDAKVKQFAEATAANPVRYAWQGNYKTDRTTGPFATQGGSAFFTAVVNPWPSENIECNPITVSWENFEKHVIIAGAETKVGKINVPAVANGGTDDSMSRMVVEAYDGNGQFIGTTDPAASGGTKNLRIDETTGDIYFTWPEYRGTDLATDKNVNFSVLAKPRTVDQLQAAAENNNFGEGATFDSSNLLTRYNKANVIDSKAFSLDDTEYHSPKYDKTDATIISGVDSATGPIATEPQKVTFTQTPDLIKDLAKKEADGGYEAKVTLDEKYVYEGWTVEMDENYNVTVTAPENPRPGTFARPVITVEYSNGSTDKLELLVVVDPNNTQVTDLVRPSLTKGHIGDDLTAQVGTKSIMKGYKPVHPAKFEIDESTVPAGWTVTVDDTGKVTAKADDTVAPGTIITPKVKATYPDQTTDEIETQFQAIVDIKIPTYDTVTNKPTAKVSLKPEIPERGLSGNTTDEAPKRYTFPDGKTQMTVTDDSGTWTVKIDEDTGEVTTTIPRTAPEGYILNVPVLAYYDNADKPQEVKGTVVVLKSDFAPTYSVESTGPNQAVNHQVQDAPKGSKFSFGKDENDQPILEQEVDGWKYTIDPNTGVVSSTPPADSKPGDKKTINVTVTTPDGSTPLVPVTTVVKLSNNWEAEPSYPVETVYPGDTAKLPVALDKPDTVNVAKENPYKLGDVPAGWQVEIAEDGTITATAPADAKAGDQAKIPVTVTYEDGSTDTAYAVVNVVDVPTREVPFKVEYKYDDTIPAGEYKVETKGKPGKEKMNKDGTWERSEEPQNEVVVIGTKPAASAKEVTWKVPIPYPTEVRENPDLKPGETRVVQEGENGEKTFTAKFTATGDQAEVVEEETTKEPVKRIVEYGPGIAPSELVTKTEKPIPFDTKVIFDDTLEAGKQVVDQKGEVGTEVETSTQKLVDGKPSGDPVVTSERTKEPTEQIIRVGTKTTGEIKNSVEAEVPFGVKVEFDPNLPAGTSKTVTEGKPGKKTITVTQKVTNSQPDGEATVEEKVTQQPVDQVIKVGTKPSEASSKVTWTAQVPFEVITRPNPELKPGEIKVVQKGVPGEKTYTADFKAKGDQATVTPEEKQTKDPVNEIIEYGPAAEDTTVVTRVDKPVPFETEIVFDNTLKEGEQKVDQQGQTGTEVVTSTQKIVDGKPSGDPEVTTERTKEPVKQIIRVGTKTTGTHTSEYEKDVPFETEIIFDENLEAGKQETVQEGKLGKDKVTTTLTIENSTVVDSKTETKRVTEPVKKIIKVGTKGNPASTEIEWTENTPFGVEVRVNPELQPGETKVVQEGKPGEVKHTVGVEVDDKGNVTKGEPKSETVSEPVKQIIEVGPAKEHQTELTDKHTENTPYDTIIEYDPNLEVGKVVEDQAGAFGEKEITKTWKLENGKPVGDPEVSEKVLKDPQPRKIRVGAKCNCETPTPDPTEEPTTDPTDNPSDDPTPDPTGEPSEEPSEQPSDEPTAEPSEDPSEEPTPEPSDDPSETPTGEPSETPSEEPSQDPSEEPSETPSEEPSQDPSEEPSEQPSDKPSEQPSDEPSDKPSETPSQEPSQDPSERPSDKPSDKPSDEPGNPGDSPSDEPSEPSKPGQPGDGSDGPGKPGDSTEPGDSGKPGPLPRTGTEVALAVAMGLGMIGAGVALTVASRRNRRN
ncbi:G5 domain-containing protein [Brevibacterium sp. UMB1308A]|uniref:G5 domain-containing protein n=1 Tax=Brevibacterium sp. UMB1308A TaxID=3050608 RepID=UPI002549C9B9|nr:G5 domain-containing protein [Brevibacterium sp. UMB1308A]MDK8347173.1 G5 domain-containing protein [Brevibacterium sp. UMB1308B]MDK8714353.1 G5 domain-containing protein [Brevibacterium sp. UMB1308A]